tara:strand:- start:3894 stop:5327 length:1434 start_codon:yes stop_codon:yes gene_type:complete
MPKVIPVILCGGKGTRLWPLSRQSYPKQFLSLCGEDDKSLLQKTYERISNIKGIQEPIIICNEEHRFLVAEQMRTINVNPKAIILEPEGRNTAPAIALGTFKAIEEDENSIILVLSADHIIKDVNLFQKVLIEGFKSAQENNLVTFGVIPNRPEIGYGYIESESNLDKETIKGSKIIKFIEKPNEELAYKLIESKKYTWNSGMFVFKTKVIINELQKYAPLILKQCNIAMNASKKDLDFIRIDKTSFLKTPDLPIDIAVMEKTEKAVVIPLDVGWSDIGSWKSLWESQEKDSYGNVIKGKVINDESTNCYLKSESRLLVTLGLKDLIVVETQDAILVASKEHSNNLKALVDRLKDKGHKEGILHKKIYRPWGSYTSLIESENWLVKKIEVNPGAQLSLQMHNHRAEHWVVVSGKAAIQVNEKHLSLTDNQSTFIPLKAKHRLKNPSTKVLTLIEIQSGDLISEDDIIRFNDDYGRIS